MTSSREIIANGMVKVFINITNFYIPSMIDTHLMKFETLLYFVYILVHFIILGNIS